MTRTSIASRFVAPATVALAALMLVASPIGLGKSGLVLQQAKASTSVDTNSPDNSSNSPDKVLGQQGQFEQGQLEQGQQRRIRRGRECRDQRRQP